MAEKREQNARPRHTKRDSCAEKRFARARAHFRPLANKISQKPQQQQHQRQQQQQQDQRRPRRRRRRAAWLLLFVLAAVSLRQQLVCAKGLVGKLPGNFPTKSPPCPEESCPSDPQHVLHALKIMGFVFLLVLALPVILYFLSKLCSLLCGGGSGSGSGTGSGRSSRDSREAGGGKRSGGKLNKSADYDGEDANFSACEADDDDDDDGETEQAQDRDNANGKARPHQNRLQSVDCQKGEPLGVKFEPPPPPPAAGSRKKRGSGHYGQQQPEPAAFPGGAVERKASNLSPASQQAEDFNHDIGQQNLQLLHQMMTDSGKQQQQQQQLEFEFEAQNLQNSQNSQNSHNSSARRKSSRANPASRKVYPEVNLEPLEYQDSGGQFGERQFRENYAENYKQNNPEQYFHYQHSPEGEEAGQVSLVDRLYQEEQQRQQQRKQLEQRSLQARPARSPKQQSAQQQPQAQNRPANNQNSLALPTNNQQLHRHSIDGSILNRMVYGMQRGQEQVSNQQQQQQQIQVAKFNQPADEFAAANRQQPATGRRSSRQLGANGPSSASSRRKQLHQKLGRPGQAKPSGQQLLLAYEPQKLAIQQADRRPSLNAALMQQQRHHL